MTLYFHDSQERNRKLGKMRQAREVNQVLTNMAKGVNGEGHLH